MTVHKSLPLTREECSTIFQALRMWSNFIETGEVVSSAEDLKNQGRDKEINVLNIDQMRKVVELHDLAAKVLK